MILKLAILSFLTLKAYSDEVMKNDCHSDLKMIVTGLDSDDGQIKFDLDNEASTFKPRENGKPSFAKGKSLISGKRVEYVFKNIPCGDYAVKFYHDSNMNEDLDKNFIGVPKEQYGFSNCKGCMLPPSWEKAKFHLDTEHAVVDIQL